MSTSINPNTSFNQEVRSLAKAPDKKGNGPMGQQVSEFTHAKKTLEVLKKNA